MTAVGTAVVFNRGVDKELVLITNRHRVDCSREAVAARDLFWPWLFRSIITHCDHRVSIGVVQNGNYSFVDAEKKKIRTQIQG